MTTHLYAVQLHLTAIGPDRDAVQSHSLDVSDELDELEQLNEQFHDWSLGTAIVATTGSDHAEAAVQVDMTVAAATWGQGLDDATTLVRTAIHGAGGATPGWDDDDNERGTVVYRIDAAPSEVPAGGVNRLTPA